MTIEKCSAGDPKENLYDSDIRIVTPGMGGTNHDIKMLTTVILTVAMDTIQGNIQTFGRLRNLRKQGIERDVRFLFFNCSDIDKHYTYYQSKNKMLKKRSATLRDVTYPDLI